MDIAFTRQKLAVSIHGCWWHGCSQHGEVPAVNADWWRTKIERNRTRDAETRTHLESIGWVLIEVWEHDEPEAIVAQIEATHERLSGAEDRPSREP